MTIMNTESKFEGSIQEACKAKVFSTSCYKIKSDKQKSYPKISGKYKDTIYVENAEDCTSLNENFNKIIFDFTSRLSHDFCHMTYMYGEEV